VVIVIIVMGAFQATQGWGDLVVLLALGLLGWAMKQTGFGRPPLIVGFVLGSLAENYLGLSLQRYGMTWIFFPWVIAIGILTLVTLFFGIKWQRKQRELERHEA
jgi:TctA family transporter